MSTTTVHLLDYDAGNLRSMTNALRALDAEVHVIGRGEELGEGVERLIMPGVGAFGAAMASLRSRGLIEPLQRHIAAGRPMLGVCVGFQVLFERSGELGDHVGLGVIPGRVVRFEAPLIVPHMGWNEVVWRPDAHPALADLPPTGHCYFVHSFYPQGVPEENIAATSDYGAPFVAAVARRNLLGVQFHPEKSGPAGLQLLQRWLQRPGSATPEHPGSAL